MFSSEDYRELEDELRATKARVAALQDRVASLQETNAALNDRLEAYEKRLRPTIEPDYEALGYPETEVRNPGMFTVDEWVDRRLWSMLDAGVDWCRARDVEKENDGHSEKG